MDGRIKRIFLETTCSLDTSFTTGIQRVVRSVVDEADAVSQQIGVECVPVVFRKGRFYDATTAWQRWTRKRNRRAQPTKLHFLSRELNHLSPRAAQFCASARVRLRKLLYPKTLCQVLTDASWQLGARPVSPGNNDVLLLLDETWRLRIWPSVERARARGCRVGAVVYDLIPIDHPQFFLSEFVELFAQRTQMLLQHSDFLLPISETVASRLRNYIDTVLPQRRDLRKFVTPFRLGAATTEVPAGCAIYPRLQRLFHGSCGEPTYLCVGTLEPRKNHGYLLDAFELVWKRNPQVRLCIAGRVGWKCDPVQERIRRHPQFGKSLFLFTDLNDVELFACYRHARALISCSVDEGFDLPIVEGLRHGLRVLASDIAVHREIGRDSCQYFDLSDPKSLADQVLDIERVGSSLPSRTPAKFATWRESCEDLLGKALAMTERVNTARTLARPATDSGDTRDGRRSPLKKAG